MKFPSFPMQLGLALLLIVGATLLSWLTTPARVLTRTLGTDNVIASYERFIDLQATFEARVAQASDLRAQPTATPEDRTDLNAVTQSCREIAASYNADASKLNKQLFMDRHLPPTLDPNRCTGGPK